MQTGSSETLIGWQSRKTTFVPLLDRMEDFGLRYRTKQEMQYQNQFRMEISTWLKLQLNK